MCQYKTYQTAEAEIKPSWTRYRECAGAERRIEMSDGKWTAKGFGERQRRVSGDVILRKGKDV